MEEPQGLSPKIWKIIPTKIMFCGRWPSPSKQSFLLKSSHHSFDGSASQRGGPLGLVAPPPGGCGGVGGWLGPRCRAHRVVVEGGNLI